METVLTMTLNPALDLSTGVEEIAPERKLRTAPLEREPGGGGINAGRGIHALGGRIATLDTCGRPTGQMLEELLEQEGITPHSIAIKGSTGESEALYYDIAASAATLLTPGTELYHPGNTERLYQPMCRQQHRV